MSKAQRPVLFDFFGTLVSYSESRIGQGYERSHELLRAKGVQLSYREFLASFDETFERFEVLATQSLREYSMDDVCSEFLSRVLPGAVDALFMAELRDQYLKEWSTGVKYIPGVTELVAELARDFRLVLVSNTHHAALVHGHLERMQVGEHFSAIVTSVEYGHRKPSAAIFDHALQLVGETPERAVLVGDSFIADYQGSTGAGVRCLLIDPERRHDIPEADRLTNVLEVRQRLLADAG